LLFYLFMKVVDSLQSSIAKKEIVMLLNELYVFLRLDLIIQQVKGNIPADDERLLDSLDKVSSWLLP